MHQNEMTANSMKEDEMMMKHLRRDRREKNIIDESFKMLEEFKEDHLHPDHS